MREIHVKRAVHSREPFQHGLCYTTAATVSLPHLSVPSSAQLPHRCQLLRLWRVESPLNPFPVPSPYFVLVHFSVIGPLGINPTIGSILQDSRNPRGSPVCDPTASPFALSLRINPPRTDSASSTSTLKSVSESRSPAWDERALHLRLLNDGCFENCPCDNLAEVLCG